jgi:hypothetical protein
MEKTEIKIEVTAAELREAISCYDLLLKPDIESAYAAMLEVPEFGLKLAQAMEYAAKMAGKGKMEEKRILDAAVVPAFLIGMLVGKGKAEAYATFQDTGERRLPKLGEWYFLTSGKSYPMYYAMDVALGLDAKDYGILRLVESQ